MNVKTTSIATVRNLQGVRVRRMCGSCLHKRVENDGGRTCRLMQLKVQQGFECKQWQMADDYAKAGCGAGKVKRREYLMMVFEVRMQEREALDKGLMTSGEVATPDSLRKRFEEETGLSPFINI